MSDRDQLIEIVYQNAVADRVRDGKDLALVPVVRKKVEEMADAILAAGFGLVSDAGAKALEDAADDFEGNVGVGEFAEQSIRDGAYWMHIQEAWDHQGPYMDWLRNCAESIRSTDAHG